MLQAKADNFLIGADTEYIASQTKPFIAQCLAFLKYIVTPEDTSAGAGVQQHAACKTIHSSACSIIKTVFWFTASIIFCIMLGQLC